MQLGKKKWKKLLAEFTASVVLLVITLLLFISPLAKYVIQKYDMQILGRKIRLDWVYINPFTGYVHISNLKVYAYQGDSLFFSAKGVSANFAILKMLKKTYEIKRITLDEPWGIVIQNKKAFNFDDFIVRWTPKDTTDKKKEPVHFNILNIAIKNGEFHYIAQSIPVHYYIKNVNIESPGRWWNIDSMLFLVALNSGPSEGTLNAVFSITFHTLDYHLSFKVDSFDLQFLEQYLHDITRYGNFAAKLDADIKTSGNFGSNLAIVANGQLALSDFHFGKKTGDDYASFDKLIFSINDIEPLFHKYDFDTVMLNHPYFKYERYDYSDNLQRMFGQGGVNYSAAKADSTKVNILIVIANYFEGLAKDFIHSYYKANKVAIYNGDLRFNDFSLREEFSVASYPLNIIADTIDKNHDRMNVRLQSGVKPYGSVTANLSLDPNDYGYFDFDYRLQKVPIAMFNPYVISYTSFPLDKGTLDFNGQMIVEDSMINSNNHLLIIDPIVEKRIKKKDVKWIPVPLIMSLVLEPGGGIDYEIPIKGSLQDPKFKFRYVILDILRNIFVKPPATPYLIHVKHLQNEVERFLTLKWNTRQVDLTPSQQKFIVKMVNFLRETPHASIGVYPFEFTEKEKEYVLFYEARKKYFLLKKRISGNAFDKNDSLLVDKMSVKDSGFVRYLNKVLSDSMMFTIQDKCISFLGSEVVDKKFRELLKAREKTFMSFFSNSKVDNQVKIYNGQSGIPYNGFSYYRIVYNGDFPNDLLNAYQKMNDLNESAPRDKFEKERNKTGGILMENKELNN